MKNKAGRKYSTLSNVLRTRAMRLLCNFWKTIDCSLEKLLVNALFVGKMLKYIFQKFLQFFIFFFLRDKSRCGNHFSVELVQSFSVFDYEIYHGWWISSQIFGLEAFYCGLLKNGCKVRKIVWICVIHATLEIFTIGPNLTKIIWWLLARILKLKLQWSRRAFRQDFQWSWCCTLKSRCGQTDIRKTFSSNGNS